MKACVSCGADNPDAARFCSGCGSALAISPEIADTRRLVTMVFCDLVDSTALGGTLDPESMRAVLRTYFEQMREVVERHGGTVEKFIGDAIMAVFGVPRTHEDDALRAIRAATEMRDALEALNKGLERDWGVTLRSRIGVDTGEVVAGDPSSGHPPVTGETVNRAARFEQAAGPGEILLGDETYRLVRDAVAVEDVGDLALKGFEGLVHAHRLLGVTQHALGHSRRFDSPLVNRDTESALLRQTLARVASDRRCHLFTVLGPPGIGKSRLIEEFIRWADSSATHLRGRCLPYGEGITFWPVTEIVQEAAGLTHSDPREVAARKLAALMSGDERGALVAERVGQAVGLTAGTPAPEETLWAIRKFFETLARRGPLVLVFDDIHWAEPTFLELIEHVADRSRDVPMLLVCLARPELLEIRPTWGGGRVNATTILLDPLAAGETEALVTNLLGPTDISTEVRDRIVETAGGYPLFAEEIVSVLIDDGILTREGDRWVAAAGLSELSLPSTITGLLSARLDRLDVAERAVIECASVIGRDFSTAEVAALCPSDLGGHVDEHLLSLGRKELIRPTGSLLPEEDAFRFRHELIRASAYEAMAKSTRAGMHERYAGWLEEKAGDRIEELEEVVAHHLERAHGLRVEVGPAGPEVDDLGRRAARRLASSGRRAHVRGDMPAAAGLLRRAVTLLPRGDPERTTLLPELAESLWQAGEITDVRSVCTEQLSAAHETDDPVLEAIAMLALSELTFETDPTSITLERLREIAEHAIRVFEADGEDARLAEALVSLGTTHWLAGEFAAMLDVSQRALALAQQAGSWLPIAGALNYVGRALVLGTTPCDQAAPQMESLVGRFAGQRSLEASAGLDLATILAMVDIPEESERRVAESRAVFEDLGQGRWVAQARYIDGLTTWWRGEASVGEPMIRSAYEWFGRRGEVGEAGVVACDLAHVLWDLGRVDEAERLADETARTTARYDMETQIGWRGVKAKIMAQRGEDRAAAEDLLRGTMALLDGTEFLNLRATAYTDAAELWASLREQEHAREAAREALDAYRRKGNVVGYRRATALVQQLA